MAVYTDAKIIDLITSGIRSSSETNNLEFKDGRGGIPKDLWKPISAFSHNPEGGVIIFGISEDDNTKILTLVQADPSTTQEGVFNYFQTRMVNALPPDIRLISYEGFTLIAVIVSEAMGENKPCYEKNLGLPNGACIRIGNTNKILTQEEMRQMIRHSSPFKFDKLPVEDSNLDMLSKNKIDDFLERSAKKTGRTFLKKETLDIPVLKSLNIVTEKEGLLVPTVAGFLIFAKEKPQHIADFSRYVIRCVRYSGVTVASPIIDKVDVDGTLDQQIDMVQKFILRNIPLHAQIIGTKRVENYEYPEDAIRELVANAIIHRDYRTKETYTQVSIFSNRVEISNPGNLPPGISIENIKDAQFSRNEIIASILKDMDYLEEYGRGVDIVFSRMAEEGLLDPIFKNISNSFRVVLLGKVFSELNERQVKIWHAIQEVNRMTARECILLIGDNISRATISNDLNKLIELNLIKQVGSTNNTYYTILN